MAQNLAELFATQACNLYSLPPLRHHSLASSLRSPSTMRAKFLVVVGVAATISVVTSAALTNPFYRPSQNEDNNGLRFITHNGESSSWSQTSFGFEEDVYKNDDDNNEDEDVDSSLRHGKKKGWVYVSFLQRDKV